MNFILIYFKRVDLRANESKKILLKLDSLQLMNSLLLSIEVVVINGGEEKKEVQKENILQIQKVQALSYRIQDLEVENEMSITIVIIITSVFPVSPTTLHQYAL
ncbi:hypothetical protein KFK09_023249 [Dendrobium nobile]|uniref:Uncharacterized protein n=1 Tax=Dendrobium nobile TaxID=94219 RepID=A0A8T3AKZ9_DENNO|nr:hypothetical protein KFK09_023249 [Dendrobium nobile]